MAEAWSGRCLFYAGRLNAVGADPGIVPNNVIGAVIARVLGDGGSVIYIDTEGAPGGFASRLRQMGVAPDAIITRSFYLECSDQADSPREAHRFHPVFDSREAVVKWNDSSTEKLAGISTVISTA